MSAERGSHPPEGCPCLTVGVRHTLTRVDIRAHVYTQTLEEEGSPESLRVFQRLGFTEIQRTDSVMVGPTVTCEEARLSGRGSVF